MSFIDSLQQGTNQNKRTENGALTNDSTLDPVLDFFSQAGAMRGNEAGALKLFQKAYAADKTLAARTLFYLRDVRGGQGERDIFRALISRMPIADQAKLARFIPEYGRWDDLLHLDGSLGKEIAVIVKEQLAKDEAAMEANEPVSLLAKWLPSENASSKRSKQMAQRLAKDLELKPSQYRRTVVKLRKHIKLLEQLMSQKEWSGIKYDKIPSQAHRKHVKAFKRNDEARYTEFIEAVNAGEKKVNAGTLFTYEVFDMVHEGNADEANAVWKNLPDWTNGHNALVLADVSGSMSGRPMSVSVSLALYFAEHNKGAFHDYFMTFSAIPKLQKVTGTTLTDRMRSIETAQWDMNTDLNAAFQAILNAAKNSGASQDELPKVLYVISDMEFDQATSSGYGQREQTNFEAAKAMFHEAGYELPHVVFWNVDARNDQGPATKFDGNVTLISGSSQSTFQYAVAGKTPIESMNDILNSDRYSPIVLE